MSAICGIYYRDGRPAAPEKGAALLCEYGIYQADTTGIWHDGALIFGCHVQHITPESVGEVLPFHDGQAGITITADAIIDNRAELGDLLCVEPTLRSSLPDSQLILLAYQKWGSDCPKYLLGDYAFVIWDEGRQKMFCAVDPTGTRAFYYYLSTGIFAFSTLMRPLFVLPEITKKYNETWIADYLAIPSVAHQLDPELTLYEHINLLPAGHILTVGPDSAKKEVYWQAERQPELKLASDAEYEEAFRGVLGEAVRCRLRSTRRIGVQMSGGLDSTTVASLAARELAGSGQRLLTFSAVPMFGYRNWLSASCMADETPYIEAVGEHNRNIDIIYCRSEGKHSLSDTDRFLAEFEQPYKLFENLFWIDEIMATAQMHNVGVVLSGGAGNATISWGERMPYLLSLYRAGKWLRLFRESWSIARSQRRPVRSLYRLYRNLLPEPDGKHWFKIHDLSPINPDFASRSTVAERFRQFRYEPFKLMDSLESRLFMLSPAAFSHLTVFTTKHGLANQLALRDPTMDRRVIEFCLSVPDEQYVRYGRERHLIRRAMAGIIPEKVRLNETVRGIQYADWAQRLGSDWPELKNEISKIGMLAAEREYLDIDKIQRELGKLNTLGDAAANNLSLRMLARSLIFSRFLRKDGIVQ